MRKIFQKVSICCLMILTLCAPALTKTPVFAASCSGVNTAIISCNDDDDGINHILKLVVEIMTIGVGILGVVGITVVGIQYLTAGGSEEKVRKAKRRMFEIVIGLAVYVLIFALLSWLIPGFDPFI